MPRAVDAQTIEDAARALVHVSDAANRDETSSGYWMRAVKEEIAARWPELSWRLRDLVVAVHADPPPPAVPDHYRHNQDAVTNRTAKADAIAAWGSLHGLTARQLLGLEAGVRRAVERAAGVRRSSDDTWAAAAGLLARAETLPGPR